MTGLPFDWVYETARLRLLAVLSVLILVLSLWLTVLGQELNTAEAPNGIVTFELAASAERAGAILGSWDNSARTRAMLIQGIDFLYLFVYPAWFSLSIALVATAFGRLWLSAGSRLSWAVLCAAPLDAVENLALIRQLMQGPSEFSAQLAWWCAVPKFVLVLIALAYLVSAGVGYGLTGRRESSDS